MHRDHLPNVAAVCCNIWRSCGKFRVLVTSYPANGLESVGTNHTLANDHSDTSEVYCEIWFLMLVST